MDAEAIVTRRTYAGLFMVTLATLLYEILLTRIFSVTMWYHYAFVAISIALFGMTVGAVLIYLFPNFFTQERTNRHLALSSLFFAVSIVVSFLTHLTIPFVTGRSLVFLYSIALTYVVISVPFVFSGICVSLALTRFPQQVSKLYAADLAGAAFGCILLIYILRITDAPTAVIVVALLASIGTLFLAVEGRPSKLMRTALICSLLLALSAGLHTILVSKQSPVLRLVWVKGQLEHRPLYEKWNPFSRIWVSGDLKEPGEPLGWGLSSIYPSGRKIKQLALDIDASAGTVLTAFDGDVTKLDYLKYDVTNVAHYIRHNADVLVVGSGGGRDVLSALVFDQRSVVAVEINREIIDAVNRRFGDFSGHLDKHPRVTFINDEARSYIARQRGGFDIIQVSLIDTWAATAAGAFVLTENSLYTVEAWKLFLERLTPNGVLTFSRWYFRGRPGEMYRLTSLAAASLKLEGVEDPRNHIVIVRRMHPSKGNKGPDGIGTILVSKESFSDHDLETIEEVAGRMRFDVVLTPKSSLDSTFSTIAAGKDLEIFTAKFPLNITPPTDESPFFFSTLRLRDVFNRELWQQGESQIQNVQAVIILGVLLIIVTGLTFACIIVPLALTTKKTSLRGTGSLFVFFATIGFGFMLVEISQMQRLIVFLGHPTYALSVVLFTLLLSSGLGSYLTRKIDYPSSKVSAIWRLGLLLSALILFGKFTPYVTVTFQHAMTTPRILVAIVVLFPLGVFMGMAFPLGMKVAATRFGSLTPWFWGINGATSVCASVVAVAIAMSSSISASFWAGFACYGVAFLAFVRASQMGYVSVAGPEVAYVDGLQPRSRDSGA